MFQFLIGSLKTNSILVRRKNRIIMFQFLIGSLKTYRNGVTLQELAKFQFLIGSLKTHSPCI